MLVKPGVSPLIVFLIQREVYTAREAEDSVAEGAFNLLEQLLPKTEAKKEIG